MIYGMLLFYTALAISLTVANRLKELVIVWKAPENFKLNIFLMSNTGVSFFFFSHFQC